MQPLSALSILLIALSMTPPAQAGLYRWVDENGVTQYSQTPPPNQDADRLKPPPPPVESPQEARRRLDLQLQREDDRQEDRALAARERTRTAQARKHSYENCKYAQANLEQLEAASRRLMRMPDGSYKRNTEEERQELMRQATEILKEHCN